MPIKDPDILRFVQAETIADIPTHEQEKFSKAVESIASSMLRVRNIQSLNKKGVVSRRYAGRGELDINRSLSATIRQGSYRLMESVRERIKPVRPKVCVIHDVSSSIKYSGITRGMVFISCLLAELFGGAFSEDLWLYAQGFPTLRKSTRLSLDQFKNKVFSFQHTDSYDIFSTIFFNLDETGFFEGPNPKFIFNLTDGNPATNDVRLESRLCYEWWSKYKHRLDVHYVTIQMFENRSLDRFKESIPAPMYLFLEHGFLPPFEDYEPFMVKGLMDKDEYNDAFKKHEDTSKETYLWGKKLWEQFQARSYAYLDVKKLAMGYGFEEFFDVLMVHFKELLQ